MPKRTDIHKILVVGSGPIVIGQAAEFDYAGSQACRVLKAAAMTYVAALITSLAQLLRLVLLFGGGRDRD